MRRAFWRGIAVDVAIGAVVGFTVAMGAWALRLPIWPAAVVGALVVVALLLEPGR